MPIWFLGLQVDICRGQEEVISFAGGFGAAWMAELIESKGAITAGSCFIFGPNRRLRSRESPLPRRAWLRGKLACSGNPGNIARVGYNVGGWRGAD